MVEKPRVSNSCGVFRSQIDYLSDFNTLISQNRLHIYIAYYIDIYRQPADVNTIRVFCFRFLRVHCTFNLGSTEITRRVPEKTRED